MGKLDYDHGDIYIVKGSTHEFNLYSTAKLTEETKARYSTKDGCTPIIQLSLQPLSASVPNGFMGLNTETVTLQQILKITGHKEQTANDEPALVEWFYSSKEPSSNELPCHIHKIKFMVLGSAEEHVVEDGEMRMRLGRRNLLVIPEGLGNARTPENVEQVFYRLALNMIDRSGRMLKEFELELRKSRTGRIDWSPIFGLPGVSYIGAINKIFHKLRHIFLSGQLTYTHINELLHAVDNVIANREKDFTKYSRQEAFDQDSHKHVISFWKSSRTKLVKLLHYIDIQSEIRKNDSGIIRDDLVIGITDTDFQKQTSIKTYVEDFIARLIIPIFLFIIIWFFWSR